MGHCHPPTPFSGPGGVCAARSGAHPTVTERRELARPYFGPPRPSRWLVRLLLVGVRVYQGYLSPLMPLACKFYPSCSRYAYEAIERYGARRGAWLAIRRLLRCRPFVRGGIDPVPEIEIGCDPERIQP